MHRCISWGLGAILVQNNKQNEVKVIVYKSGICDGYEKKIGAYKLEILVIMFAYKIWRKLHARKFTLYTYNQGLTFIRTNKDITNKYIRWF